MFEGYAVLILADMPIRKAAAVLRCNEKSLVRILRHWVGKAVEADDLSGVESIAVDETSFKKGHSYVTVIVDAQARRVIDVEPGRGVEQVEAFSYKLEEKGGSCEKIHSASSDMSSTYCAGIQFCFPNAKHTVDKFHVKKLMLEAMDAVRRAEQKAQKSKALHLGKRVLMIPETRQSEEQKQRVTQLCREFPKTGRAFRMVQALDVVYASPDEATAGARFDDLFRWLRRSRLEPMKKVALTLKRYRDAILNFFATRITNAICEGINSMIQAAKRKARGYNTFEGFSTMIYLVAAKLQLACPNPLRLWE
jgi:transposase